VLSTFSDKGIVFMICSPRVKNHKVAGQLIYYVHI